VDLGLLVLQKYADFHVLDFQDTKSKGGAFLLVSTGAEGLDYWPRRLLSEGHSLTRLAWHGPSSVYLVDVSATQ
jgi:hypothetical protein